jgi:hypothetical protein
MSENSQKVEAAELGPDFYENQRNFPPEQLRQYAGRYVAWSLDGSRILASAETMEAVEQQLIAAGIKPSHVVGDYIPPPDTVLL